MKKASKLFKSFIFSNAEEKSLIEHDRIIQQERRASLWNDVPADRLDLQNKFLSAYSTKWYDNLYILCPLVYLASILLGSIVYYNLDGWDTPTSLFFSAQTLLGIGAGAPSEADESSYIFSTFFIFIGQSIITGAVILIVQEISMTNEEKKRILTKKERMRRMLFEDECLHNSYFRHCLVYLKDNTSEVISILVFIIWLIIGVMFAHIVEEFDIPTSIYFIISLLSGVGNLGPNCVGPTDSDCTLGWTGYFLCFYVIVGFPLYAVNMGYFAFSFLSKFVANERRETLLHPWSKEEFMYASHILKSPSTEDYPVVKNGKSAETPINFDHQLTMGEFILMEMYRLGQIDENVLIDLKELFQALDKNHNDVISFDEIMQLDYSSGRGMISTEAKK